jgi:hypothetical protein
MTLRQAQRGASSPGSGRVRAAGLIGIGVAAVLLAGCTSNFLAEGADGGAPTPSASTAAPEPTPTDAPLDPADESDCVNLLLDRPGNYVIGDCDTVTLAGSGIRLAFVSIGALIIRGDGADVTGETLGSVEIEGQAAEISAFEIDDVVIRGDDNVVTVDGAIGTVNVRGNGNVVTAGEGIDAPVVDNGLNNELG